MNALEEFEIYSAYNNDDTKPRVWNDQLLFKSNILYDTALRYCRDKSQSWLVRDQLPYGVHRLTVALTFIPVSYTHLDVYKRQIYSI